jgi:membrane protein implicated in regulation of membrane protease activity
VAWQWWLLAALVLAIAEEFSLSLVLLMFAAGAIAAGIASALGANLVVQIIIAIVVAVLLLLALRPWLLRHLRTRRRLIETNVSALVGRPAVAVTEVGGDGGRVKIGGEVWTARTVSGARIATGTQVRVALIDGATAVVEPIEE